ncbi:Unknown protein, partial [Striga hermonthica]
DKFLIFVNYGGRFIKCGTSVEYLGGSFKTIHGLDVDRFGYFDLKEEVEKLGVDKFGKLVYIIPRKVGADNFKDVVDNSAVMEMIGHATRERTLLEVYVVGEIIEEGNNEEEVVVESASRSDEQFDIDSYIDNFSKPKNPDDVGLGAESQKDCLLNALKDLAPHVEHRNFARHVYMKWKKSFKGFTLKTIFWKIVLSTHLWDYNIYLEDLKFEDPDAYDDFMDRDPTKFCKAYISSLSRCYMIENNVSETFNELIVKGRSKHIIDMLELVISELMKRQHDKLLGLSGYTDQICPRIRNKLEHNKYMSRN